ncbi:COG8 [Mytilus edulis]|uniref:Conserved oligomeric Golgi complex subunit 8 n=1 Tax=Mytilus edulis TaxID=6550 RepID=A0A8S3RPK9_MYTED|nr:COG8 [Mytilus edulis]
MTDVEDENILTSIFKESFPDSWTESPDFIHYLSELSSYGVSKLSMEPDRLSDEKSQILQETQNLAFTHYKTFIQTAECSREIFEDFQIIEKHVDNLLQNLPSLSEECEVVTKQAQEINSSRRMNNLGKQRNTLPKLKLEVLEIPQLMDTCVRNGYFEEALELAAHVKRLEKKHSTISVINNIVNEVKNSTQLMLNHLIQQLRTNVQLPACLRVIGYLRRMDVFTEAELRIKFLQARDSWFQGILRALPKDDPYTHITKTIEASRVHLFDIITQYRAIFSDEDPLLSTAKEESINEAALFHGWVVQKVSQFLSTLESDLQIGVGGRLDSILGQCMYFGLSFSRVGADFRGLLAPIFQRAALNTFTLALTEAIKKFEENMQSYNLLNVTSTSGSSYTSASQAGQMYPPNLLLDFYPLAAYCNHILTAFNELRLCAPISMACEVSQALESSLQQINRIILAFHRAEETTFDKKEKDNFDNFCTVYVTDLVPYLNKCLQTLFPPAHLAQILGVSILEFNKMGNLGIVDITKVLAPIEHLIPKLEPIDTSPVVQETDSKPVDTKITTDTTNTDQLDNATSTNIDIQSKPLLHSETPDKVTFTTGGESTDEELEDTVNPSTDAPTVKPDSSTDAPIVKPDEPSENTDSKISDDLDVKLDLKKD